MKDPSQQTAGQKAAADSSELAGEQTKSWLPSTQAGATCDLDSFQLPGNRYQVVGEVARGGMGVVLPAIDSDVQRHLAVKVMLGSSSADLEKRFLNEARVTGQLQHPGIPPVHEIGRLADGRPYFSMKLIQGSTLAELLSRRDSPQDDLPRFLKVFQQIAQTVAFAHSQRVIHRDLKPSNIMVGAFGEVQVMDWGLAKRMQSSRPPANSSSRSVAATMAV